MLDALASHFWVGHLPRELAATYFAEVYGEDREDAPLSLFARDQGVEWYGFSETAASVEQLVAGYSFSDQWGAELARRAAEAGLTGINWFAFISESEIQKPRSVSGKGYWVRYLGTIRYHF
ncbi:MAG: immunity 22 family protein [Gemmataceae bacterium]|nr:immunity 22 family protein [Gemmataceae bacterium]